MQIEGMFDVAPAETSGETWNVHLPLEEREWNIGLIVGPSGCGKSTIAREVWGDAVFESFDWPPDKSVLDAFPKNMSIKDISALLSSVGFSSPPLWLRPYRVLSTGQKMRVDTARLLAQDNKTSVMDEFTSVVDRTVAQIGSAAIARTVRKRGQRFVAVTCHYDVTEWLQPDWVYQPHTSEFLWRFPERFPRIELEVKRVHHTAWRLFKQYHYLSAKYNTGTRTFVAFLDSAPVALVGVIIAPHPNVQKRYRIHRAVCLPDYQGVGIGKSMMNHLAGAYKALGMRMLCTTGHPALIGAWKKGTVWRCIHHGLKRPHHHSSGVRRWRTSYDRITATFEYVGDVMDSSEAQLLIYGGLKVANPG